MPQRRPYRSHSPEFKEQAVKMVIEKRERQSEVARKLGISVSLLASWISSYKAHGHSGVSVRARKLNSETERIKQLERELERTKMERDILKKAAAYFARENH